MIFSLSTFLLGFVIRQASQVSSVNGKNCSSNIFFISSFYPCFEMPDLHKIKIPLCVSRIFGYIFSWSVYLWVRNILTLIIFALNYILIFPIYSWQHLKPSAIFQTILWWSLESFNLSLIGWLGVTRWGWQSQCQTQDVLDAKALIQEIMQLFENCKW